MSTNYAAIREVAPKVHDEITEDLATLWTPRQSIPCRGGHAFVHLTALCPVACRHCMYSSDLQKTGKVLLTRTEFTELQNLLHDMAPTKLTISGGGEPFLRFQQCLDMVSAAPTADIEIITAGNWATSRKRSARVFDKLAAATKESSAPVRCGIRVSLDSFHRLAPRPVTDAHYVNIIHAFLGTHEEAWERVPLSFRGLLREREQTERYLADLLDVTIEQIDEWNSVLRLPRTGPRVKITYNVMRFSGAAAANHLPKLAEDISMMDYFAKYAGQPALRLSQVINDASRGAYSDNFAAAITIDSDGSILIFAASPPDRRARIGWSLNEIQHYFSADPLTQWLYHFGPLPLLHFMKAFSPQRSAMAVATEDVTSLVPLLLSDPVERTAARLYAVKQLSEIGLAQTLGLLYRRYESVLAGTAVSSS